jgi:hypothetical protein
MYVKDLAAIARLTLVVAGSLPAAAVLDGKTLPGAMAQTGNETDSVVRGSFGRILNDGVTLFSTQSASPPQRSLQ